MASWVLCVACLFCPPNADATSRTVRVGVYQSEPKIQLDAQGRPSGILGDLLRAIGRKEGWTIQAVPCRWRQCLDKLASGAIDLLPDMAYSDTRAERFDFHREPALHSWSQIYRRKGVAFDSVLQLEGHRILVLDGSVQQHYLDELLNSFGVHARMVTVRSLHQAFAQVRDGRADAVVASHQFGERFAPDYHLYPTPILFQPVRLYYATTKGRNADLLRAIDHYLETWKRDTTSPYFDILSRWGGDAPQPRVPGSVWRWMVVLGGLLLVALGGTLVMRRQIAVQTRDLRASEEKLNSILDSVEAFIYIKDRSLKYRYGNRKVRERFDISRRDFLGHGDQDFLPPEVVAEIAEWDRRVLENGERVAIEETVPDREGRPTYFYTVKLPLRDAQGRIYALCGISTDMTAQKRHLEEIHQLAFYDPLTGLPNRRLLIDRLEHALASRARNRREGALLFVDLDNFKDLNDTRGHAVGDHLLQQVAARLSNHIRESDTLARLGGDEFVLMFENLDATPEQTARQVEQVATKLLDVITEPFELPELCYNISASIGVAMFSDAAGSVEELLKRADLAMYEAKGAGRNRVSFFNPQMQADVTARSTLEADLRDGLRDGHFQLHYQPQVDAAGSWVGVEALVRWAHPQKGLIAPADFIPVAEDSGLILPLGRWIIEEACRQLVEWSNDSARSHLRLAINISASQLHHGDFVADVLSAIVRTGANPHRLELELTESQLIEGVEETIHKMVALRSRGVHFSLDDFGTGFSSLGYLKRLPLDHLKIDQSFVRDLLSDPNDLAIVKTVIALGRSLDLSVIAEGVESNAQWQALLSLGCEHFQGYLFGLPAPIEALFESQPADGSG